MFEAGFVVGNWTGYTCLNHGLGCSRVGFEGGKNSDLWRRWRGD